VIVKVLFAFGVFFVTVEAVVPFAVVVIVIGFSVSLFSIVGMIGSGFVSLFFFFYFIYRFYEPGPKKGRLLFLRIFWLASLITIVILFLFGAILLASPSTIEPYFYVCLYIYYYLFSTLFLYNYRLG
jgi:hypothetical protein